MNPEVDARFVFETLLELYKGTHFEVELVTGFAFARWPFYVDDEYDDSSLKFIDEFCRLHFRWFGFFVDVQSIKAKYLSLMMPYSQ